MQLQRASQPGECEGGWIWKISDGHVDDVRVNGLAVAGLAKWPGAIHEGGGRAHSYLDSRADGTQRAALTRVLRDAAFGQFDYS